MAAAAVVPVTFVPSVASAQDAEALGEARAKFQRGIELEQAGNYSGALKLFREVGQVKMTPQVRYHIATSEEGLGQLVAALGGYELALAQSEGMHPAFIADVEKAIEELHAKIPKLVIERGEGAEAATIQLDGVTLGTKSLGTEIPRDPGPHTVSAKAPGYEDFSETVTVAEGETKSLEIEMVPLPEAERRSGGTDGSLQEDRGPQGFGLLPYILGGAGIAVAATGGVLLGVSQSNAGQVREMCGGEDCTALGDTDPQAWRDAKGLADSAQSLEIGGWVAMGVGTAALAAGTVLFFIDPTRTGESEPPKDVEMTFVPGAPMAEAGLSLVGHF